MGQRPYKEYRAINGIVVRRSFGNLMTNYTLELVYENTSEQNVTAIWNHYHNFQNQNYRFFLPDTVFQGYSIASSAFLVLSPALGNRMQNPSGIRWYYAEPPVIESVVKSLSNVTVKLIGELDIVF